jgi:hypothetical protein
LPRTLLLRPVVLVLACALLGAVLASCGSGSSSTGSPNGQAAQGRRPLGGFAADPKVRACLQKQGLKLPTRPNRPGGSGGPPPGGRRPGQNSAQAQKLQKALKACGVTRPAPGQGGPAGTSQTQTTS